MIYYNKLVRDRIPEIIESSGKQYVTRILEKGEYALSLNQKLQEEIAEFLESGDIEELADLLELIYAIAELHGISQEELEERRMIKREKRGGFEQKILLVSTS